MKLAFARVIAAASLAATLPACVASRQPVFGGFSSIVKDPLGALEEEPPDVPPDQLVDPVRPHYGALSIRWVEDLKKSSRNFEADPDDPDYEPPAKKRRG